MPEDISNTENALSLNEIQQEELKMLIEVDRICRSVGLSYTLACGTLLGAVRHQGFIPWDDDVDVGMPRPDYEKFLQIFDEFCECDNYFIVPEGYEKSESLPFTKILNSNVVVRSDLINTDYLKIDIFPIDGLPSNKGKRNFVLKRAQTLKRLIVHAGKDRSSEARFKGIKKIYAKLAHVFAELYGEKRGKQNLIKLAKNYKFVDAEFCGVLAWPTYGGKECFPKIGFDDLVEMTFENHEFLSISCWDLYLNNLYGDYMQLPPEKNRKTHGLNAFYIVKRT